MNEIANLCEKVGADVDKVRIGIGSDDRIGKRFLFPGIGYGGSCFPKDVQALAKSASEANAEMRILKSVMEVNESQKTIIVPKLRSYFNNNLEGKKIAIWGLAFKPDTDDIREAPALYIIKELQAAGATVTAYDPEAMNNVAKIYSDGSVSFGIDEYSVLENADALVICTEWSLFRTPDFGKMKKLLCRPAIFDGRNLYGLDQMQENGFYYVSIGRAVVEN
jgi:UDPglucose 6-dehydrogenase